MNTITTEVFIYETPLEYQTGVQKLQREGYAIQFIQATNNDKGAMTWVVTTRLDSSLPKVQEH